MYSWKVKKSVWYYIMSNDENVNFQCYASRLDCITGQWSLLSRPERGCHLKFTREVYLDVTIKDAGILVGFVIYIWRVGLKVIFFCHVLDIQELVKSPGKYFRGWAIFWLWPNVMRCAICYHLYNLKNVENTHRGVLLLVVACNFTKSNTPPWVFFTFFKLYKWYQIVQCITNRLQWKRSSV